MPKRDWLPKWEKIERRWLHLWTESVGETTPEGIMAVVDAKYGEAWRISIMRDVAAPELIAMMLDRRITNGRLWLLSTLYPKDHKAQVQNAFATRGTRKRARKRGKGVKSGGLPLFDSGTLTR